MQMPKCFEKILKYSPGEKSLKATFTIYLDLEYLLKNMMSKKHAIYVKESFVWVWMKMMKIIKTEK